MKVKPITDFINLPLTEKAGFLGKRPDGFRIASEHETAAGCFIVEYSYHGWGFNSKVLIIPLSDTGYCQIIYVD